MKSVPFIAGTIAEFYVPKHPYAEKVNKAIEALPNKIKRTAVVSSSGLKHKGDEIHFSSDAARESGKRYAEAFNRLIQKK